MRNTLRYSFATVMTAGLVIAPVAAAFADANTDGSGGIGSGNQIIVPVDVEADLCGNSLAVLGISSAKCTQVSEVLYEASGNGGPATDGSGGIGSGNQIIVPVDAAIDACGNSLAVGGISEAECIEVVEVLEEESADAPSTRTDGSGGIASGNQIVVPVDAAINVCGNSVAILGGSSSKCTTIINIIQASPENEGGPATDGSGGVGSGNQVLVPVDAAVDICGNAVSVLGLAQAACMQTISDGEAPEPETPEEPEEPGGETPEEPGGENPEEPTGPEVPREEDKGEDDSSTGDDRPTPQPQADEQLAVTGTAIGGLVAAAVAAIGAGGAGLYFARKRKAAAAGDDE
ncbi:chaplin family protein [Nocardiopsis sp. CT-R113]|uniref:Chaplin family protein n=1 Tax=Nocardiopsis codii TaxID=3065942 RepID=A0ABU7KAI7_9ACTN|nr:chaplin family protein [Nocardiopsis sp. CT-R113]MEE2039022.1 chaplin family protein [Nocardiopsis sp. CT-R113]